MKKRSTSVLALLFLTGICSVAVFSQSKQAWVAPKAGVWKVSATDEENTKWTAEMRVARRGVRGKLIRYRGYFSWRSEDSETSGREFFNGSFDRFTGTLRLKAYRAKARKANWASATIKRLSVGKVNG